MDEPITQPLGPSMHGHSHAPVEAYRVPDHNQPVSGNKIQIAITAMGVFFYTGASLPGSGSDGTDPIYTSMSAILLLSGIVFSALHWRRCLELSRRVIPFFLLAGLAAASIAWSQAPEISLRRTVTLFGALLFSVTGFAGLGPVRIMKIVVFTMLVIATMGLVVARIYPDIGMDVNDYADAVRGLYGQKNTLGVALLDTVMAVCFLLLLNNRWEYFDIFSLSFIFFMLFLSRSTTSLVLSVSCVATVAMLFWLRREGAWRWFAILSIVMAVISIILLTSVVGVSGILELLGKDSSLTGRTEIWEAVQSSIGRRAFLGYGYAAFWLPDTREVQYIWSEVGWHTPTAHSGYLEIVLQFGVFGEILLSVLITFSIIRIVIGFIRNNLAISAWVLMFLVTQAIVDRTESGLFSPDLRLVFWVVGILALVDRRKSQAFPAVAHFRCGAPAKFRHP